MEISMNNRKIQNVFDEGLLNNKLDALWVYRIFFFIAMYSIKKVVMYEVNRMDLPSGWCLTNHLLSLLVFFFKNDLFFSW
jgi:hypothetical protein